MSTKRVKFLSVLREHRAKVKLADTFLTRLKEMSEKEPETMLEMGLDDMEVDMPMAAPEESPTSGDEAVKAALRQAILAVFDGPDDSATTIKKIKMLMDVGDKISSTNADPTPVPDGENKPDMEDVPESIKKWFGEVSKKAETLDRTLEAVAKREKAIAAKEDESACRTLLESKEREVTGERLKLLSGTEVGNRDALVESWPKAAARPGVSRPRYAQQASQPSSYDEVRKSIPALSKRG